ncbi:unnamed protein product [Dovyalis caffra]|uniref:Uncharacterized protein n=1 Tax=Dovyalis caffra TaxID=77055 RepID=A0AAV1RNX8_9ROSI|nr:unnamed protein product [Dovyalis caffra]
MASTDSSTPPLCAKGCGFFGCPENKNLCSKCYKDYLKEEVKLSELVITPSADDKNPAVVSDEKSPTTNATATATASSSTRKTRCENCNKKVGLTGFNCRCGKIFCGMHRHAEEHSCTFDFKTHGRQERIDGFTRQLDSGLLCVLRVAASLALQRTKICVQIVTKTISKKWQLLRLPKNSLNLSSVPHQLMIRALSMRIDANAATRKLDCRGPSASVGIIDMPRNHCCIFDFKTLERQNLAKQLVVINLMLESDVVFEFSN